MEHQSIPGVVRVFELIYEEDQLVGNVEVGLAIVDIQVFYTHAERTVDLVELREEWCKRNPRP